MTEKDKKLLLIAGILIVALAVIMFGIKPGITSFNEAKEKRTELTAKKTSMQTEINALSSYKVELDAAVEDYNKTADRVYGDLTKDKVQDAVVNELVTPCGLSTTNLTMSISKMTIARFVSGAPSDENSVPVNPDENTNTATINVATVGVSVFGTSDQIITLLDKLNSDEGILVQQTSFGNSAEGSAVSITFLMALSNTF